MIGEALIVLVILLSFANGSNDVSTGIATLVGSGICSYRKAIVWGTLWTVTGSLLAAFFALEMVRTFSMGGLLSSIGGLDNQFPLAITAGAFFWVLLASRAGLPVSTTHAITGAFCGVGIVAVGFDGVNWSAVGKKILLPLAFSPFIALGITWLLFPMVRKLSSWTESYCVCLEVRHKISLIPITNNKWYHFEQAGQELYSTHKTDFMLGDKSSCSETLYSPFRMEVLDIFHWISAGLTSFARGVNDTPKIAALAFGIGVVNFETQINTLVYFIFIAAAIGLGSLRSGLRVTETLADKVTPMDNRQGLAANLTTSMLVTVAARFGLPVSTTHVSGSSVIGIGLRRGKETVRWKVVREMLLAWIVTIPVSALIALCTFLLLDIWF